MTSPPVSPNRTNLNMTSLIESPNRTNLNMQPVAIEPLEASLSTEPELPNFLKPEFNKGEADNFDPKSYAILYQKDMKGVYCKETKSLSYVIHEYLN